MSKKIYYYYLFLDGTKLKSATMSGNRLAVLEYQHGKLVRKERA